eukprot:gene1282-15667_t
MAPPPEKWAEDYMRKIQRDWMWRRRGRRINLENKNLQLMYLKIKCMTRDGRPTNTVLKNKDGKVVMDQQDVLDRWAEYIRELFNDNANLKVTTVEKLLEQKLKPLLKR